MRSTYCLWQSGEVGQLSTAIHYRVTQWRARDRLRPMRVGRWTEVRGRPRITATDAEAGDGFRIWSEERTTYLLGGGRLRIGDNVFLNSGARIDCFDQVTIGNDVLIGHESWITDTDSHSVGGAPLRKAPVTIHDGCWIAARVTILPGVTVGRHTVVAANSVVVRDLPSDCVAAGNPARVVRSLVPRPQAKAVWQLDDEIG